VVAGLIVRGNEILICQRRADQALPLKWEFPGGKVEPGEPQRDALRRELQEELGILAQIGTQVTALRHRYPDGFEVDLYFYRIEEFSGEIRNCIFQEVRWVLSTDLPLYDFLDADVPLAKKIASGEL